MALIAILLLVGSVLQDSASRLTPRTRLAAALAVYLFAGFAGGVVALAGPWQPASHQNVLLAVMLPFAVPLAAFALAGGVGLGNSNLATVGRISEVEYEGAQFEMSLERDRQVIRNGVTALTHGPLRGRLSACAMALNFHAVEVSTSGPERTEYIVSSVREHLANVLEELDTLG